MEQKIIIEQITEVSLQVREALKNLTPKIGHNYKELTDQDITDIVTSPNTFLFFAKDTQTNTFVGMVTLLIFRIPYVKKGYLDDLIVDESHRGRGIAANLMKTAIAFAKEKGVAYVDLTARPRRAEGNSLYEKLGFQKRETNVYRLVFDYAEV